MSDFVRQPLKKKLNKQNPISAIQKLQAINNKRVSLRAYDLATIAGEIVGARYVVVDPNTGYMRLVMSGENLQDEIGASAHLAGIGTDGTVQFYVDADTGKLLAGAGAVALHRQGEEILRVDGATAGGANYINWVKTIGGDKTAYIGGDYDTGTSINSLSLIAVDPDGKLSEVNLTGYGDGGASTENARIAIRGGKGPPVAYISFRIGSTEVLRAKASGLVVGGGADIAVLDANTYTPTLTNVTNLAASTAYACQWMRVGNIVTVSGRVDVDPTATGACELGVSLPVASNFANAGECGGAGNAALANVPIAISGDATNDRAQFRWVATDNANRACFFSFTYQVI